MKRIAAFVPNVLGVSPGQRVRIETWARPLAEAGWTVDFYPFEDGPLHEVLYQPGRYLSKLARLTTCYWRQFQRVLAGPRCDVLFFHREAALVGPALLERLAARRRVPVVYDIDDPVFVPYRSPVNGWFSLLKFAGKTHALFRLSDRIIAINRLIGAYAERFNPAVSVVPNAVDTDHFRPAATRVSEPAPLVWTGSQTTMPNLTFIASALQRLQRSTRAPFHVIGVGKVDLPGVEYDLKSWSAESEVHDLQVGGIGILPVPDRPWNHWKFFLKLVQYMAVGLPVVASRIGSNCEIIEDGVNGFLVDTIDQWYDRLFLLVTQPNLRQRMGDAARKTAVRLYSTKVVMPQVVEIFERVLRPQPVRKEIKRSAHATCLIPE